MGRRQIGPKKKKPSDYGLFSFRTSKANIERLNATLDGIQERYNNAKDPDDFFWSRGDIIVAALEIGLAEIRRSPKRFRPRR